MSCRMAYELDLASFLGDPTGAAWAEFRDHYPRCPVCTAEVRAWTDLHLALGAASHPEPEALLRFVDAPESLGGSEHRRVAGHLETCAGCRDETRALRRLDPLAEPAAATLRSRTARFGWTGAIGRVLWHPAFAYAVALIVGLSPLLVRRTTVPIEVAARRSVATNEAPGGARDTPPATSAARDAEPAAPAAAREERSAEPPAAAPPPTTAEQPGSLGAAAERKNAPLAKQRVDVADTAGGVVLSRDVETIVLLPRDAAVLVMRIAPPPTGAASTSITDDGDGRALLDPDGAVVRVPTAWLRPGRYTVEARAGERVIARARVRVAGP